MSTNLVKNKNKNKNRNKNGEDMRGQRNGRAIRIAAPDQGVVIKRRQMPRISQRPSSIVICNTESFFDITTATAGAFATSRIAIWPAQTAWLNGLYLSFSKFRWLRVRLIYVPTCATSTSGAFSMGYSYDNQDTNATSINRVQALYNSVTCPSWGGADGAGLLTGNSFPAIPATAVAMDLDVTRMAQPWYPTGAAAAGIDANQQIPAFVQQATVGGPAVAIGTGTIFIKYEIEFIEPIVASTNG
nr:MAG: hypothetical protein 4 [Regressovirinae sp.]